MLMCIVNGVLVAWRWTDAMLCHYQHYGHGLNERVNLLIGIGCYIHFFLGLSVIKWICNVACDFVV